jgi:hypothetical protein
MELTALYRRRVSAYVRRTPEYAPLTDSFERCYVPQVPFKPEWRNWHTQQTQNGNFVASARFETLLNRLILQKKTTSTASNRLLDFSVIFEALRGNCYPTYYPKFCRGMPQGSPKPRDKMQPCP